MEDYQRYSRVRSAGSSRGNMADFPVAMAYVPWQQWNTLYDLEKGLETGTIFPELNRPFLGVRNVKGGCK